MRITKSSDGSTVNRTVKRNIKQQIHQLSWLVYIPTCQPPSPQILYNNGRHQASGGLFLTRTHMVCDGPMSLSHRANDHRTCYRLFTFWTRGDNPWAKVHQKWRWPTNRLDLPSYKISSPYVNPRPRYPLPNILRTNKQTEKQTE